MSRQRYSRLAASSGFIFVVLFAIAFGGFIAPNAPKADAAAPDWASYYVNHQSRIQAGLAILCVATFAFLWFLGNVRERLAAAEGNGERLTAIAFGGGLMVVVFAFLTITATAVAAFRPGDTS